MTVQAAGAGAREGRTNVVSGTVREMLYLGSAMKYEVALADGAHVIACMPTQGRPFAIGSTVELAWNPGYGTLLADDGSTAGL